MQGGCHAFLDHPPPHTGAAPQYPAPHPSANAPRAAPVRLARCFITARNTSPCVVSPRFLFSEPECGNPLLRRPLYGLTSIPIAACQLAANRVTATLTTEPHANQRSHNGLGLRQNITYGNGCANHAHCMQLAASALATPPFVTKLYVHLSDLDDRSEPVTCLHNTTLPSGAFDSAHQTYYDRCAAPSSSCEGRSQRSFKGS